MNAEYKNELKNILSILIGIEGFTDFFEAYSQNRQIVSSSDMLIMVDSFKEFLQTNDRLNEEEKIIISRFKECVKNKLSYSSLLQSIIPLR